MRTAIALEGFIGMLFFEDFLALGDRCLKSLAQGLFEMPKLGWMTAVNQP